MKHNQTTSANSEPDFKFVKTIINNKKALEGGVVFKLKENEKIMQGFNWFI